MNKNYSAFSLTEMMVVILIFGMIAGGILTVLTAGQMTWFTTETSIDIQQNLRITLERISRELHESGRDKTNTLQVTIDDGAGANGTDILRFSIPVVCETGMNAMDANGDVAYWRAPLRWGCADATCMDADNDCDTLDYKYIQYLVSAQNQLVRRVLDSNGVMVREDIFANNISDFQVSFSPNQKMVVLSVSAQKKSAVARILSATTGLSVHLRNQK